MFSLIFLIFFSVTHAVSAENDLVITEVMFNPDGNENAREFVEILNRSSEPVSLEGCSIGDGTGFNVLVAVSGGEWIVQPGSYALIMDPDYFAENEPYESIPEDITLLTVGDKALGSRGFSNSTAESIYLISAGGDTLSVVQYSLDCPPGHSWERILPHGEDSEDNFSPSKNLDGTPGFPNSVLPPPSNPALDRNSIRFNPACPRMGEKCDIIVNFLNSGLEPVSNIGISITVLPDFFTGSVHFSEAVFPGERSTEGSIVLENFPGGCPGIKAVIKSDGDDMSPADDTLLVEIDVAVPPGTILLNEVMAAPVEGNPEWVEIMNTSSSPVDVYHWTIRDFNGRTSNPINDHVFVLPDAYAVISSGIVEDASNEAPIIIIDGFPALNNDGDSVSLIDCTMTVIDSMAYDDTQTGDSLELISEHMSGSSDGWDLCVDPSRATPGERNSIYFTSIPDDGEIAIDSPKLYIDPNPFLDAVTLSYELPFPLARVRLLIYDRRGRLIATIRDVEESGSSWSGRWNGRSGGKRLPAGPYILDFEVLDKRTGKMFRVRKTVVVASRL